MQIQLFGFLLLLLSFPFSWESIPGDNHAIYLSLVEVDHKDLGIVATVKVKVFADDMEDAMMNAFKKRINFLDASSCDSGKSEVEAYFEKYFSYRINNKLATLTLVNCEANGEAIWLYFKIDCPDKWTRVEVKANFLMELFPTQANIITIYHGDEKRFLKITHAHPEEVVTF